MGRFERPAVGAIARAMRRLRAWERCGVRVTVLRISVDDYRLLRHWRGAPWLNGRHGRVLLCPPREEA